MVYNGETQECLFVQVMHMKQMFDILKEKKLLTKIIIPKEKKENDKKKQLQQKFSTQ